MMIKKISVLIMLVSVAINGFSQSENEETEDKKFALGFYFDKMPYYNNILKSWQLQFAPYGGYYITKKLQVGLEAKYSFESFESKKIHYYSGGAFARYTLIENIAKYIKILPSGLIVQGGYEMEHRKEKLRTSEASAFSGPNPAHIWWLGPGLTQKITKKLTLNFILLWNLKKYKGARPNPVARVDLSFDL